VNVSAAGTGPPDPTPSAVNTVANAAAPPGLSPHSHSGHDSVSGSLGQLTSAPILNLLQIVEGRVFPEGSQHLESSRTSSHSAIDGFYSRPAQTLGPGLAHSMFDVRDSAEKLVAKAAHTIEAAGVHGQRIPDDLDPRAVIALANQLIATGQLPNYLRAAEMGRVVISWYDEASPASVGFVAETVARNRQTTLRMRVCGALGRMWRRAPLLVLLIGWLLSGGFAGLLMKAMDVPGYRTAPAFKIWAIGFPALVVFQFVVTIRGALRPKSGAISRSRADDR
jgi:hypothetical protein